MKIVLSTWGTAGDADSFLALAEQLLDAGHEVRACTSDIYRERFVNAGVGFHSVGLPFDENHFHRSIDTIVRVKNPLKSATLVAKTGILYGAEKWFADCLKAMKGYDLAICHSADIPGQEAAIQSGLPWISVSYCPGFIKTVHDAPHPAPNLGVPVNRLIWRLVEWLIRSRVDPMFNDFLTSVGGQPRDLIGLEGMYSPDLNLLAASPIITPPPPDLPEKHKFTGRWFLDELAYQPPAALQEFLDAGSPPIVITFGSMGGTKGGETTQILVEAVRRAGVRAILQAGWGKLGADSSETDDIFCVGYVPHDFLFRHGCCVIHHGGAGTVASACRAGIPSIVVPHLADQSYWGDVLYKLGVAPKLLFRYDMTAKRLAKRIRAVVGSKKMAEKAKSIGKDVRQEDGLGRAVELIERFGKESGIQ